MIDSALVCRLLTSQFPKWKDLPVRPVKPGGWDNRIFRLGDNMLVRMPSAEEYAVQVEKEHKWPPRLAPLLPLTIPEPLALGEPAGNYTWKWSIYRWLEGEIASSANIADLTEFAKNLATFLIALQLIEPTDGPLPGPHSFYRGGSLLTYDAETRKAIDILKDTIDIDTATKVWETALATTWTNPPVWVHGDISSGNLLVQKGRLSSVIDFGMLTIGDPACDLAIAWTLFEGKSREIFRSMLPFRSRNMGPRPRLDLVEGLDTSAGLTNTNAIEATQGWRIIDEILTDHRKA